MLRSVAVGKLEVRDRKSELPTCFHSDKGNFQLGKSSKRERIYLFCSYLEQDPLNIIDLMAKIVNVSFCLPDYTLHERYSRPNLAGFYLRKKVAGSTLKIEGSTFGALPRMCGPLARARGEPERGVAPSWLGGLGGHPQENFENWMMKYAISGYQGTIFAAVFKSLIVYLFVWKIICDVTITLIIRPSV